MLLLLLLLYLGLPPFGLHNSFINPQRGTSGGANSWPTFPPGHCGGRMDFRNSYNRPNILFGDMQTGICQASVAASSRALHDGTTVGGS